MFMEGWIKQSDLDWVCKRVVQLERDLAECESKDRDWILSELANWRSQRRELLDDLSY